MIPQRLLSPARTLRPAILAASIATLATVAAHAQTSVLYQAPTGTDGKWNLYEYVLDATDFATAHGASSGILNPAAGATPGFLTEIGSAFENAAVSLMTQRTDAWIGLTDRAGVVAGASEGTFVWTNGNPLTYTNWNAGEPNDSGGEDAVHITAAGNWNDHKSNYGVDLPVADPGNTDETFGVPTFRYLREWNTNSVNPLPGIRSAAALSFPGSVAALTPAPTTGNFAVREIRDLTLEGNLYDTVNKALSGAGTITEALRPRLDATDPDTNAIGGPSVSTAPLPFLTDTPGVDDDNIITIANGRVSVPSSGQWTIQVRSDDGFALRVKGQSFTNVYGGGEIDPLDSSTMLFYGGTGDSNTRGVLNLNAGVYDIEFVNWEGGGGAYYEVSTAKGAIADAGTGQWLAMGDTSTVPAKGNILRMTTPATVRTAAEFTAGGGTANNIQEVRDLIATAKAANATNNGTANAVTVGDGQPVAFPAGTPADQFAMEITGSFTLDDGDSTLGEAFQLTFGLFSDDGSQFRIIGKSFDLATDFTGDGTATLVDVNGDLSLTADYLTGNTNAFGLITLTEGTYQFESYMFEEGGGANETVSYALGDKTGTGLDGSFIPLSNTAILPENTGWALVPEPTTGLLALAGMSLVGFSRRRRLS